MGYDYVPVGINWPLQRTNFVSGEDTAWIPRSERTWVDQSRGTIENWDDYDAFLRTKKPGDRVRFEVMRSGKKKSVYIRLMER